MKKKYFDFIRTKIEQENIHAPRSLDAENLMRKLEPDTAVQPVITEKHTKKPVMKLVVSLAACVAVIISAFGVDRLISNSSTAPKINIVTQKNTAHRTQLQSYDQLKEIINNMDNKREVLLYGNEYDAVTELGVNGSKNEMISEMETTYSDGYEESHETTYLQVDGVDEADIIKNDGKYIYTLSEETVRIYQPNGTDVTLISKIELNEINNDTEYIRALDMFLYNDTLIVNLDYSSFVRRPSDYFEENKVYTIIYDISDKQTPKLIQKFSQDGSYISSRITGNHLYTISAKWVTSNPTEDSDYIPSYCNGEETELISCDSICIMPNANEPTYAVITSINLDSCEYTDTKAVLGGGSNIYCSMDNLYVYYCDYPRELIHLTDDEQQEQQNTHIQKFNLNDGEISFVQEGTVSGYIYGQYALDEKDGYLRVATTVTYTHVAKDDDNADILIETDDIMVTSTKTNYITILDENMQEVGRTEAFAVDEGIEAVKYIGDMAYVITYRQTDPLFVINLSDPASPEIKGSVKITGFSSMLHPVDENTLLGVGQDDNWSLKLALFDISDSANPKVLDSMVFKDCNSEAQYNPKAFMVNRDKGYFGVPYYKYVDHIQTVEDDIEVYKPQLLGGAKTFTIENGKINLTNDFSLGYNDYTTLRCTYIGDYVYVVDCDTNIKGFEYK